VRQRSSCLQFQSFVVMLYFLPFLQTLSGSASLRARVRRAKAGLMPCFTRAWTSRARARPSTGSVAMLLKSCSLGLWLRSSRAVPAPSLVRCNPTAPKLILPLMRVWMPAQIGPELPFGPETMRVPTIAIRTAARTGPENGMVVRFGGGRMLAGFAHQFLASLPAQPLQTVELFRRAAPPAGGLQLRAVASAIVTVTRIVDSAARAADRPAR